MTQERRVSEGTTNDRDVTDETTSHRDVTGGTTREGDPVDEAVNQGDATGEMGRHRDVTREPNWSPKQLETDDGGPEPDRVHPEEMTGGIRGGGGATWNKGSMEFDEQETIPPSRMKESEEGPWGTADQGKRAERQHRDRD